ncbi:SymE family type I addiction module toxin [Gilvimarinus agarilyticus]|uniref:SymE family type I addiction module toxin n=1 Tax=Gilvimarinus agarilyticus TaxID=679259 RepID=UPI0005A16C2E|nr:SymE family type I addiction module toxin [Gilvimarinus agarilyticus]
MAKAKSTHTAPVCHTRQIKMGQMRYDYRRKDRSQAKVPWLRLQGHWLERAGFAIDAPVTVRVMAGCLVLTTQET